MARKKRKTPGINGSSSADIAFMLLIFFLVTTSMDTDKGLKRRLPPLSPREQNEKPLEINDRNIMRLLVDRMDRIAVSRKVGGVDQIIHVDIENLKDEAVRFITNPDDDPTLPEKEDFDMPGVGKIKVVTKGSAISLKTEIQTSYQMFIRVQNELLKAYNEVWESMAQKYYKVSFAELPKSKQDIITEAYPIHISEMPLSNLAKE